VARVPWGFAATLSLPLPSVRNLRRPNDAKAADSVRVLSARRMREMSFPIGAASVPETKQSNVTGVQQSFRIPSFRNHCGSGFVQYLINIRLGTGRGFRYAYSEKLPLVCAPFGVGQHTREVEFVEAVRPLA
jgi:hypothetical protein